MPKIILKRTTEAHIMVPMCSVIRGIAKIHASISVSELENITHDKIDCAPKHLIQLYKNTKKPKPTKGRMKYIRNTGGNS
jgi:hypothetical protein